MSTLDPGPEERPLLIHRSLGDDGTHSLDHEPLNGTVSKAQLERSLLRKLDRRMSILILIYILNCIDRNNASAARLRGFEEDLHLEGNQFASILSILYVGYILMQIPSNMVLAYMGQPSIYLPSCMVLWGLVSMLTGITTNFFEALCARFFLGFVEAAFFPGALFLISKWYKKNELSKRTAFLFCGNLISSAVGALIASGILDAMDGVLGFAAWRWLFFVEGSMTVMVAVIAIFILPDFPENPCSWLTPAERTLAMQRLMEDIGIDNETSSYDTSDIITREALEMEMEVELVKPTNETTQGLQLALADWKVWWLAMAVGVMTICFSFTAYFPTLGATLGYNTTTTLLLCAPPWVFSTLVTVLVSRHSDRTGERFWHIVSPLLVAAFGFLISIWTMNTILRYLSLFLMVQGYAGYVCFLAWVSGTISRPSSKRAVALAFVNCGSTVGNIFGAYVWPSSWGPTYSHSYSICMLAVIVCVGMCFVFRQHLRYLNKKSRSGHKYLI